MTHKKIIAVHLPKTAGTSFNDALKGFFGEYFLRDDDFPISKQAFERNLEAVQAGLRVAEKGLGNIKCVHGHFLPIKYLLLGCRIDLRFITWMRNPVDRMISHYHYIHQTYNPKTHGAHHRMTMEQN